MTDFNFDPNTMTRAYAQRKALTEEENVRPKARPKGIASKPDDGNTDTSSDKPDFYDKMLDKLLGYFSSEDDADKVLSDKAPDRQDTQTSYEDMFGGLSQETLDAVEQAKQKRMGPADRRDVDVVEEAITEEEKPKPLVDPKDIAPDLQIMEPEGIEDMPPLPKPATDDGGLMSRDTSPEEGETTTDAGLMSKPKVKEDTGYTVKSGDTFDEIAKDNNITPADLRAANPDISDYNKIIVGQEINLGSSKIGEGLTDDDMGLTKEVSEAALFSKIVGGESDDYNTVYLGSKVNPIKPITEMTVKEVREWQDTSVKAGSKSSAAGRFQIIRSTMDTLLSKGAIAETDIFDEETQLKAYTALLKKRKYPQLKASIQNSTDPDEKRKYAERLQINLAMEFASIPVPKTIKKDYFGEGLPIVDLKKGQSFYYNPKKPNLNKAQHKSDDFMTILMAL